MSGAIVLIAALAGPALPVQQVPVFPTGVEQVVVDVVVVDAEGRPVVGLAAADFLLEEERSPREILTFEAVQPSEVPEPSAAAGTTVPLERVFAVVFDDVHLTDAGAERAKDALREMLSSLRDDDQVILVSPSGAQGAAGRLGDERASLVAALNRLRGLRPPQRACEMSDEEARRVHVERDPRVLSMVFDRLVKCGLVLTAPAPLLEAPAPSTPGTASAQHPVAERMGEGEIETLATAQHQQTLDRLRRTLSTLERLLLGLAPLRGRKAVVLASEGFVRDWTAPEQPAFVNAASDANAAVYFLDAASARFRGPVQQGADALAAVDTNTVGLRQEGSFLDAAGAEHLADDTGGRTIRGGALGDGLRRMAEESRSYYLLGYSPAEGRRGGRFRSIRVEVRRPGLKVHARRGYYALPREAVAATVIPVPPAAPPAAPPEAVTPQPRASAAEVAPWPKARLREATASLLASAPSASSLERAVLVHTEAAFSKGADRTAQLDAARELLRRVPDPGERRALERAWRLGVAGRLLGEGAWEEARSLASDAAGADPTDAEARAALGAIQEAAGSLRDAGRTTDPDDLLLTADLDELISRNPVTGMAGGVPGGPSNAVAKQRVPRATASSPGDAKWLRHAEESYRDALKVRPDLIEARLRLGRVLFLLGKKDEARRELETAAARATGVDDVYLAQLFLGEARESQGDLAGAAQAYRRAAEACPTGLAAHLASAHLRHQTGDRRGALEALESLLVSPEPQEDPWWRYRLRPLAQWEGALAAREPRP